MSRVINPTAVLRSLFVVLALLAGSGTFNQASAAQSGTLTDTVQNAVDDAMTKGDPGDSKMAPGTEETNKLLKWSFWLVWVAIPLLILGILIAVGVYQAKANETESARRTFIAVGLGVVFWFGVMAIFF